MDLLQDCDKNQNAMREVTQSQFLVENSVTSTLIETASLNVKYPININFFFHSNRGTECTNSLDEATTHL